MVSEKISLRALLWFGSLVLLLLVSGCSKSSTPEPADDPCTVNGAGPFGAYTTGGLSVWAVPPTATDACIDQNLDSNYVYLSPTATKKNRLFVFLPGTTAVPKNYREIVRQGAIEGYHALGLTYTNDVTVSSYCTGQSATCLEGSRNEVLTGEDTNPNASISRANSIENRLYKLLLFMQEVAPADGWGQFVAGDSINWRLISIAGHSQGGGHSLFIARQHTVLRATSFASPGDINEVTFEPAPWLYEPFATPSSRIFGFISEFDEAISFNRTRASWEVIGLDDFGASVRVDTLAAPFNNRHMLSTVKPPLFPFLAILPNHNVVVVDVNVPRTGGVIDYIPIWRYTCFPN